MISTLMPLQPDYYKNLFIQDDDYKRGIRETVPWGGKGHQIKLEKVVFIKHVSFLCACVNKAEGKWWGRGSWSLLRRGRE